MKTIYLILEFFGLINILYYVGKKPKKGYKNDAGYDLFVSKSIIIKPKEVADIKVYTKVTSKKCWLLLINRSSTFKNKKLHVITAIIDNGFSGNMHTLIFNPNDHDVHIKKGSRVSQFVPFKQLKTVLLRGIVKSSDGRNSKGFGSSGE